MTLGRREKEKKKRWKKEERKRKKFDRQLFNARCRRGNKIFFSFNKIYVTRPGGSRKKKREIHIIASLANAVREG